MFSLNILNAGFFDSIFNWFNSLFHFISLLVYWIVVNGIGKIIDIVQLLFRKFAGIEDVAMNGQQGDLVLQFINSPIVQQTFWAMLALAVVLLFITTFVAVIKTEFNKDGNNSKKKVIRNTLKAIANFVIVPIVCLFGLIVGNALLKTIDAGLSTTGQYISSSGETQDTKQTLSMTSQIFIAGGYNANRVRSYQIVTSGEGNTQDTITGYEKGSMASYMVGGEDSGKYYGSFGIFLDDTTGTIKQSAADKIDDAFAKNLTIKLSGLSEDLRTLVYTGNAKNGDYRYQYEGSFNYGKLPDKAKDFNATVGDLQAYSFGLEQETITFSVYNIGLVNYYYDLSLFSFDYLICTISLLFAAWIYVITILGLIKRLFLLTTLYIISPPICALYPLDEGKALGEWRKEFIKQALSAYSVVVVMNIFFLILPLMLQIEVITVGTSSTGIIFKQFGAGVINYIARVLIVIGALLFFKDATKAIAGIIGGESAYDVGGGKAMDLGRKVVGGAMLAASLATGVNLKKKKSKDEKGGKSGDPSKGDIDKTAQSDGEGKANGPVGTGNGKNSMNSKKSNDDADLGGADNNAPKEDKVGKVLGGIKKGVLGAGALTALAFASPVGALVAGGAAAAGAGAFFGGRAIVKGIVKHPDKKLNKLEKKATASNKEEDIVAWAKYGDKLADKKKKKQENKEKFQNSKFNKFVHGTGYVSKRIFNSAKNAIGGFKDRLGYGFSTSLHIARGDKLGDIKKDRQAFDKRRMERAERKQKEQEDLFKKEQKRIDDLEKKMQEKNNKK